MAGAIALVAALVALAIAFHYHFDPHSLARSLAASVKADTGRELEFGEVGFRLLPRPALVLSEVRFGNAAWGSQPWLAQAGEVDADISLLELLAGRLRIEHVEVTHASVLLETDRDGNGNWVMGRADAGSPAWLKAIEIDEISLEEVAFTYRDGATGKTTPVHIDSARLAAGSAAAPIRFDARAAFDGRKMEVAGTIGALAELIANAPAYPVDLDGKSGAASVSVHGTIDQPRDFGRFNLALRAQLPDVADGVAVFGATAPPLGSFSGTAQLTGTLAAPGLSAIDATFGGGGTPEIKLHGAVADLRAASGIDLQLTAAANEWWRPATVSDGPRLPPFRASARYEAGLPRGRSGFEGRRQYRERLAASGASGAAAAHHGQGGVAPDRSLAHRARAG